MCPYGLPLPAPYCTSESRDSCETIAESGEARVAIAYYGREVDD